MVEEIVSGRVEGIVQLNLVIPRDFRLLYAEMPPIFKYVEVSRSDLSPLSLKYAQLHNLLKDPQKLLTSTFSGEKLVLSTTFACYLVREFHCEIYNIDLVVQFETGRPFEHFIKEQTDKRRMGDEMENELIASIAKLFINSSFSGCSNFSCASLALFIQTSNL